MLDERELENIKNLFTTIRSYSRDAEQLQIILKEIEEKDTLVCQFSTDFQKDIFIYCFDNLKSLIETQQHEFVFDFSDAVHNLPDIFGYGYEQDLEKFWKIYIEPLRRKYSKRLFKRFKKEFKGMNTRLLN